MPSAVVKKGSKTRRSTSGDMPQPSSMKRIVTKPPRADAAQAHQPVIPPAEGMDHGVVDPVGDDLLDRAGGAFHEDADGHVDFQLVGRLVET